MVNISLKNNALLESVGHVGCEVKFTDSQPAVVLCSL